MALLDHAHELIRARRFDEALAEYNRLLESGADPLEVLGHRASLLGHIGRHDEALADYDSYLAQRPDDLQAHEQRAMTLAELGRYDDAIREAAGVIANDPRHTRALELVRRCRTALGLEGQRPAQPPSSDAAVPARPLNRVIEALEREPSSYPSSVFPEIGRFLYVMTRLVRPRLVIETGCYVGYSTLCLAQALEDNAAGSEGAGFVHSFDLFLPKPDYVSPVLGKLPESRAIAEGHLRKAGLAHRVTFHAGDSSSGILRTLAASNAQVDMAFIDGDHTVKGCFRDWEAVDRVLAPGGLVLLHDTVPDRCGWLGPRFLMDFVEKHHAASYRVIGLPSPEGFGVGLIQKTGSGVGVWRPDFGDLLKNVLYHGARSLGGPAGKFSAR